MIKYSPLQIQKHKEKPASMKQYFYDSKYPTVLIYPTLKNKNYQWGLPVCLQELILIFKLGIKIKNTD
jgi:hypothetical protein